MFSYPLLSVSNAVEYFRSGAKSGWQNCVNKELIISLHAKQVAIMRMDRNITKCTFNINLG